MPGTGCAGRVTSSVRRVGVAVPLNGSETSISALGTIVSQSFTQYDSQGRAFQQIAPDGLPSDSEYGEPEQSTWRKITMLQQRRDGSRIETEVLRPNRWIELLGLKEGSVIEFDLPELQTSGIAKIQSIEPCPLIADGEGRVVIGRFVTRQVSNLLEVELETRRSARGQAPPVLSTISVDWTDANLDGTFAAGERTS